MEASSPGQPPPHHRSGPLALSCETPALEPREAVSCSLRAFHLPLLTTPPASLHSILECQGLPIVNGQCDPYATVTLAGPYRQVAATRTCPGPRGLQGGAQAPEGWGAFLSQRKGGCAVGRMCNLDFLLFPLLASHGFVKKRKT